MDADGGANSIVIKALNHVAVNRFELGRPDLPGPSPEATDRALIDPTSAPENPHVTPVGSHEGRHRKLHAGHFAFMRSVVQGLDLRASWDRYLLIEGNASDLRVVRSTIAWIRDEFAAAARREARFGTARLVLVDVGRIEESAVVLPTLEEFAEARGMEDYRQAEQIEAFEAEHGKTSARLKRRGRLMVKQLGALRWLENLIAQPPRSGDAISSWLHPTLADHLESAGLLTIAQLVDRINGLGRQWFSGIKAMGEVKARRVVNWLNEHQVTIGLTLGSHVGRAKRQLYRHELAAVVTPATAIRPLEKFIVPTEFDGSLGLFRRPQAQCLIEAGNDYQAILAWLSSKHGLTSEQKAHQATRRRQRSSGVDQALDWLQALSHTQRAYRKEVERFLLWAVIERGRALSSMTPEDCEAYRDFIADPQPATRWCGERSRERWSLLWRPFEGPLSSSAQRHAIGILKNFYGFMVDQNYLMGHPWTSVAPPKCDAPRVDAGRSFCATQWEFIKARLDLVGEHSSGRRLKFALHLLYATGIRLSEIVAAKVGDFQRVICSSDLAEDEPVEGWILTVVGKRQRVRQVPVSNDVIAELTAYLMSRGFDAGTWDARSAPAFLLGKASDLAERAPGLAGQMPHGATTAYEGIAAHTLYDQSKAFFVECANVLAGQGDSEGAAHLRAASIHWIRHTHASHAIAGGMPIHIAQGYLGHASLASTAVYISTDRKRPYKASIG